MVSPLLVVSRSKLILLTFSLSDSLRTALVLPTMNVIFAFAFCLLPKTSFGFAVHGIVPHSTTLSLSSALSMSPEASSNTDTTIRVVKRQQWGVDNVHDEEYWFNDKIHTLGNTGFMGALHAAMAPFATRMIDDVAYDGTNVRESVRRDFDH